MTKRILIIIIALIYTPALIISTHGQHKFAPDYFGVQYAGYTGVLSVMGGYNIGNSRIGMGILYGYSPSYITGTDIHTLSVKSTFYFKKIAQIGFNEIYPILNASLMCEMGQNSELFPGKKYPKGYYMTNSLNVPLSTGIAIRRNPLDKDKPGLEYGLEICTLARYLYYYAVALGNINPGIATLAISVKIFL